jgi:TRAP transporter 4TM/12TM fusion protein
MTQHAPTPASGRAAETDAEVTERDAGIAERDAGVAEIDDMEFASQRRDLAGVLGHAWRLLAAVFVIFHLWILLVAPIDPTVGRAIHVFFGAALGFALFAPRAAATPGRIVPAYDWVLIAASLALPFHYILDADGIEMRSFMGPNTTDLVVAGIGILLVLEFARRTAGIVMPLIVLTFIAYCFAGPFLPGILFHRGVTFELLLVELFNNNGVLGTIVQVSASFIIMFVVFATFLQKSNAGDYFNDLALALVGRLRGGPAKVTVLSGIMFGAVSGSAVANVVASGAFTIPMMRRVGYDRATAGAIEATSSTGGQITPPVMGAGAFIMAEVLGIPYTEIALAGVIPALLFYWANYTHCDLNARKLGIRGLTRDELPRWSRILRHAYMASPLVLLIFMLVQGFSPFRAAAWGIGATLAIMLGTALVHRLVFARQNPLSGAVDALRETAADIYEALHGSMKEVMQLIAVCAAAGIVAGVIGVTGIGGRFATMLLDLAGTSELLAMLFAMVVAIILGMGVPTTAAYAIAAAVVAPGLIRMGVVPLSAHMFIFYFAILSAITPPVALASFAAASMARADMWRTSLIGLKLGLATFIVPFMFWMSPALLAQGTLAEIAPAFATAVFGVFLLACATEGWMRNGPLPLPLRLVSGATGLMLMIPETTTDLAGLAIGIALLVWQQRRHPTEALAPSPMRG